MQKSAIATAAGAITSACLTLACCLPLSFLGAAGAMSAALFSSKFQTWLHLLSVTLLVIGFVQVARAKKCSVRSRRASIAVLAVAVVIVLLVAFAPQVIAGFLADVLPGGDE